MTQCSLFPPPWPQRRSSAGRVFWRNWKLRIIKRKLAYRRVFDRQKNFASVPNTSNAPNCRIYTQITAGKLIIRRTSAKVGSSRVTHVEPNFVICALILAIDIESVSVTDPGLLAIGPRETCKPAMPVNCITFQSAGWPTVKPLQQRASQPFGHHILMIYAYCLVIQHKILDNLPFLYSTKSLQLGCVWTTCPKS